MWLSRKTVLCNRVTQCSGSLTLSLVGMTSINDVPATWGKRIMDCKQSHYCTCIYFFPKQNGYSTQLQGKAHS